MRNTILTFLFLLLFSLNLTAEIRVFDVRSGLPDNTVKMTVQDNSGYIWFATKNGLVKYNAQETVCYGESFGYEEGQALNIRSLLVHKDGRRIWVASRSGLFLFDPDSETFEGCELGVSGEKKSSDACCAVCYDGDGNLWAGTHTGLYVQDAGSDEWRLFSREKYDLLASSSLINWIHCDRKGIVWIGTESGLLRYDQLVDDFSLVSSSVGDVNVIRIYEDSNGVIWVGTWYSGLARVDIGRNRLLFCQGTEGLLRIHSMCQTGKGDLYICADNGLFLFNQGTGQFVSTKFDDKMPDKNYMSFFEDREGGYWIGTYFDGVYYVSPKSRNLGAVYLRMNCVIRSFCELDDHTILMATENSGLFLYDPESKQFSPAPFGGLPDNIHSLYFDGSNLWVGTFGSGLIKIDQKSGKRNTYTSSTPMRISNNHVYSLCQTRSGDLIIGTLRGACIRSSETGRFRQIEELGDSFIFDVIEDRLGNIWFSEYGKGVSMYNPGTGRWRSYVPEIGNPESLCGNNIINLYVDSKSRLWLCSEGSGVCRYDYKEDKFVTPVYDTHNGKLPDSIVYGILEDDMGNMWLSTATGLYHYFQDSGALRCYHSNDGIQSKQFNYDASFKSTDGRLYFGGIDGFNAFFPSELKDNDIQPILSVSLTYDDGADHVSIHCGDSKVVGIPRRIKNFNLEMECLSFVSPEHNSFKYRLGDNDWIYTDNHSVSFINMKPGKYEVTVKAVNADGCESINECRISLYVQPPVLASAAAIIIYIILAGLGIYAAVTYRVRRKSREMQRTVEGMRLKAEQEAYDAKIHFFTQIAHEIKTPVTLIKAPLEMIRQSGRWDEETVRNLDLIGTNTDHLLSLLKELLDFRKISRDGYRLHFVTLDAVALTKDTVNGFMSSCKGSPKLIFTSSEDSILCELDPKALVKIITNLVSNSIKFARTEINVRLELAEDSCGDFIRLSVKDDGPGVSIEDRGKIFDAFYQSSAQSLESSMSGVGLGLSLVRLLVEKHGGKVCLNDSFEQGSEFIVEIPVKVNPMDEISGEDENTENAAVCKTVEDSAIRLLVVEDTEELRRFLTDNLASNFTVVGASDGVEALAQLKENEFDIVVSDIYMPNMDGFELLKSVRNDNMLCHIPFVLLSAESSSESKIKGLEKGADSYVEKPFSMLHLKAVIESLVINRRLLQKKFSTGLIERHNMGQMSQYDSDWLEKLDGLINDGMSESDFSIDKLASDMYMSRSNFQRKLRGLLNMSPNDYIKLVRLKKAAELLAEGHYKINEVCYIVGFNNPSYFASCFHKQFGILPKDFVSQNNIV